MWSLKYLDTETRGNSGNEKFPTSDTNDENHVYVCLRYETEAISAITDDTLAKLVHKAKVN